jgi:hypothetical protein
MRRERGEDFLNLSRRCIECHCERAIARQPVLTICCLGVGEAPNHPTLQGFFGLFRGG